MSRITHSMESILDTRAGRIFMRAHYASATLAALGAMLLAACTLGTPAAVSDIRYDLGPAPKTHPSVVPLPAVRMFEVRSPRALDSDAILYRMNYVDPRQTSSYAHSHWTMAPPQLLTQRLRSALAAQGAVLSGDETASAPLLTVELDQFEQDFDGEDQSHGAVTARATLARGGKVLAQRTFTARAPARTSSAAGGVGALSAASDELIAQLIAWLGMQAPLAAQAQ